MGSSDSEIASLDRVLTRLALTEEAQLEKVHQCHSSKFCLLNIIEKVKNGMMKGAGY